MISMTLLREAMTFWWGNRVSSYDVRRDYNNKDDIIVHLNVEFKVS